VIELKKEVNLNFHQKFPIERKYISDIINNIDSINGKTKEEISEITGIPTGKSSGKVVPHILYCSYMKLIDYSLKDNKYYLKLTKLGEVVYENDKYLSEKLTHFLLHYNLTLPGDSYAALWAYTFRVAVANKNLGKSFNQNLLKNLIDNYYQKEANVSPLFLTYSEGYCFYETEFLNFDDSNKIRINEAPIGNDYIYLYGYSLINDVDKFIFSSTEISIDDFINKTGWNSVFGFSASRFNSILLLLESNGIIRLNKQYSPYTLLPLKKVEELIPKLYSNLV